MTKRIFYSICLVATGVFVSCIALFMRVLYNYFSSVQEKQLKIQTELIGQAVSNEGLKYFENLDSSEYRITWIASDGKVLYDNKSDFDEMENHLEREEVKEAFIKGYGKSMRYSVTLMKKSLYSALRLKDNTVLRISVLQNTVLTLLIGMAQPICIVFAIALILSLILAFRLSKQIVEPLNKINLDEPLLQVQIPQPQQTTQHQVSRHFLNKKRKNQTEVYEELIPFLKHIEDQNRQIKIQTEKLLQKQKEFETVTENMNEGIILLNSKSEIITINRAALILFNAEQNCVGTHILSVIQNIQISDLLLKANEGLHAEKTVPLANGKYQLSINPIVLENALSGSILLALNVTEKEKAEQIRREFTANVSHELKTPLHTIAGSAELLANGMVKEEDKDSFYKNIQSESQRMILLVEDIIKLSHLDEGADKLKEEFKKVPVDLYALAEQTVQSLSNLAENKNVSINLTGSSTTIYGIPQLLQSIIYNLCDNAIKYNRQNGSVTVSVKSQKNTAVLSVSDTGIGISGKDQERIFERFYRVDKSRSKELGGTGLGLSIVKHAANLHDAKISLNSVVDGGTTITLTFPA